jgi:hypothetical protein
MSQNTGKTSKTGEHNNKKKNGGKKLTKKQRKDTAVTLLLGIIVFFLLAGLIVSWRTAAMGYFYTMQIITLLTAPSMIGKETKVEKTLAGLGLVLDLFAAGAVAYVWRYSTLGLETRTIMACLLWAYCLHGLIITAIKADKTISHTRERQIRTVVVSAVAIIIFSVLAFTA